MGVVETFLIAMLAIFGVPYLVWRIGRTDHWAPLVVVQIVCGILLGPGVFGALWPGAYARLFDAPVLAALSGIAWWGVMLFVWLAGLELDLRQAWVERRDTAVTAALALLAPLILGAAAAALLLRWPGWAGPGAAAWQTMLGIGMACAVTALPILIQLMDRLGVLRTPLGQRILRYASIDDIAVWAVLALILLDWERAGRQLAFLIAFAGAAFAMRRLMPRLRRADRWHVGLVWLAAAAFAADWSGLHFMVGAFLAGAVLDARWFGRRRLDAVRSTVLLVVMPVFFLQTGLRTSWDGGGAAVFAAAALLLAAATIGKLVGVAVAARLLRWRRGDAALIGWLLQTKALIMIVFANILLDRGVITSQAFTALLLMAVASTMLTTPMVAPLLRRRGAAG